jgi:hypothetical protein
VPVTYKISNIPFFTSDIINYNFKTSYNTQVLATEEYYCKDINFAMYLLHQRKKIPMKKEIKTLTNLFSFSISCKVIIFFNFWWLIITNLKFGELSDMAEYESLYWTREQ